MTAGEAASAAEIRVQKLTKANQDLRAALETAQGELASARAARDAADRSAGLLQRQLDEAKDEIAAQQACLTDANRRVESLTKALEDERSRLQSDNKAWGEKRATLQAEVAAAKAEAATSSNLALGWQQKHDDLARTAGASKEELSAQVAELARALQAEHESQELAKSALAKELADERAAHQDAVRGFTEQIDALKAAEPPVEPPPRSDVGLEAALADLRAQVSELNRQLSDVSCARDAAVAKLELLKDVDARNQTLIRDLAESNKRIVAIQKVLCKTRADLTARTTELASASTRMLELVTAVGSSRSQLESANTASAATIADLRSQLAAATAVVPGVPVGEVDSLRGQLAAAQRDRDEARTEVRDLESRLASLQVEVSDGRRKAADAVTEANRFKELLRASEEQLQAAVAKHDQDLERARGELESARDAHAAATQKVNDTVARLTADLAATQEQVNQLTRGTTTVQALLADARLKDQQIMALRSDKAKAEEFAAGVRKRFETARSRSKLYLKDITDYLLKPSVFPGRVPDVEAAIAQYTALRTDFANATHLVAVQAVLTFPTNSARQLEYCSAWGAAPQVA